MSFDKTFEELDIHSGGQITLIEMRNYREDGSDDNEEGGEDDMEDMEAEMEEEAEGEEKEEEAPAETEPVPDK